MLKKFLSFVLCGAISMTMYAPALAIDGKEEIVGKNSDDIVQSFCVDNIEYVEERTDDGIFMLSSYVNGNLYDRVTIQMGEDEMLYEKFVTDEQNDEENCSLDSESEMREIYKISDIIIPSNAVTGSARAGYTPKKGSLGSVRYKTTGTSGTVYRTLSFTSSLVGTTSGSFDVNKGAGTAWTVIFSAICAGFSYGIGVTMAKAIAGAVAGNIVGTVTSSAFVTSINGTCYEYNVTAKTTDGRSDTHGGETYYGKIKKNGVWKSGQTVYANYYPEFISRKDNSVASWFYQDFWVDSSFSVVW